MSAPQRPLSLLRTGWPWAVPVAVGALLRILYCLQYAQSPLFPLALGADIFEYDSRARGILAGIFADGAPDIHAPLYPLLLAFCYKLTGCCIPAVRAIQLAVNFLAWIALPAGLRHCGILSRRRALMLLWIGMTATTPFFYQAELVSESWLVPFLIGALLALSYAGRAATPRRALYGYGAAGIFSGLAAVTHPMSLFFAVLAAAWLFFRNSRKSGAVFALAAALPILPVAAFNSAAAGRPILIQDNSAFNLWLGNNPAATGGCYLRPGAAWLRTHRHAERAARERGISTERYFLGRAAEFWRTSPGRALLLTGKKALMVFSTDELPAGADSNFLVRRTPVQRWGAMLTLPLFCLSGLGLLLCVRRREKELLPFYLLFLAGWLAQIVTVTSGRYRQEMMPAIFLLAAVGADGIRWRRWWPLPVLLAAAGLFLAVPSFRFGSTEAVGLYGEAAAARGEWEDAKRFFIIAARQSNDPARYGNLLGIADWNLGRREEAEKEFRLVAAAAPSDHEAFMNLAALISEDPRREEEAEEAFREAFRRFPDIADLHYNFGCFRQQQNRNAEAEAAFLRALELKPLHQPALIRLGVLAMIGNRPEEAVRRFERALAVSPADPRLIRNLAIACRAAGDEARAARLERRIGQ